MIDPLADIVTLLQPNARFSKLVTAAGRWRVSRAHVGQPFYCVILEGECRLVVDHGQPTELGPGDFVLVPTANCLAVSSLAPLPHTEKTEPAVIATGKVRVGRQAGAAELRMLVGHCRLGSPDAELLVSLLPRQVRIHNNARLTSLVKLLDEESHAQRPARDIVLARLLEVLFIEALRASAQTAAPAGVVKGLADARIAGAIRAMHEQPSQAWTMAALANHATLSRSAFFQRFKREVGVAPMAYLLAWRMTLAKQMLRHKGERIADVAEKVGYTSTSAFSVAFSRCVGQSPGRYARGEG